MKSLQHFFTLAVMLGSALNAAADVPSLINYQGRLTNASGVPQPGMKVMSVKMYDAATSGTQLYSESLGSVAVDANGVYAFQFGAVGTSSTLVSETIATTDGTSQTFQKTLTHTPVVPGTASVTDGTFSWNEVAGNPGTTATATSTLAAGFVIGATVTNGGSGYTVAPSVTITGNGSNAAATATVSAGAVTAININNAGSGYNTGATITIAPPPAPFLVTYAGGSITTNYATPPPVGQTITATYRYTANGIAGALAAGAEQWLELTVGGVVLSPRQRVLAVPFAMHASSATTAGLNAASENRLRTLEDSFLMRQLDDYAYRGFTKPNFPPGFLWESMTVATGKNGFVTSPSSTANYLNQSYYPIVYSIQELGATSSTAAGQSLVLLKSISANAKIVHAEARFYQGPLDDGGNTLFSTRIVFVYSDNTFSNVDGPNVNDPVYVLAQNPQPSKTVEHVEFRMTVPNYNGAAYFNQSSCDEARLATFGSAPVTLTLPTQVSNWTKFHVSLTGSREQGDAITFSLSNGTTSMPNLLPDQIYNWAGASAPTTLTLLMQPAPNGTPRATSITTIGIFQN